MSRWTFGEPARDESKTYEARVGTLMCGPVLWRGSCWMLDSGTTLTRWPDEWSHREEVPEVAAAPEPARNDWSLRLTAPCGGAAFPSGWRAAYGEGEPGVVYLNCPRGSVERLELTAAPAPVPEQHKSPESIWQTTQPPRVECRWRNAEGHEGTATPRRGGCWSFVWDNDFDPETFVALPEGWRWSPMPKPEAPVTAPDEVPTLTIGDGPTVPFSLPHSPARSSVSVTLDGAAIEKAVRSRADAPPNVRGKQLRPEPPTTATATSGRKWTRGPKVWTRDEDDLAVLHEGAMCPPYLEAVDAAYPPGPGCAEAIAMAAARGAQFSKGWGEPVKPLNVTWPKTIRRGESKTVRLVVNGGPAVEYVHPDEHERVKQHLDATRGLYTHSRRERERLEQEHEARRLEHIAMQASVRGLTRRLASFRSGIAATCRGTDVNYDDTPAGDVALRQAVFAYVEQRGRDMSEVERRERERVERELLDYQTWARGHVGMDCDGSEGELRRMLSARLRDGVAMGEALGRWRTWATTRGGNPTGSGASMREVLDESARTLADRGRAGGIEARLNLQARPSDVYKPDDAYMEAFRAGWDAIDGQLRHVHDSAIAEGRRLEREKAAHREEAHDEDVRAARDRANVEWHKQRERDKAAEERAHGARWALHLHTPTGVYRVPHGWEASFAEGEPGVVNLALDSMGGMRLHDERPEQACRTLRAASQPAEVKS